VNNKPFRHKWKEGAAMKRLVTALWLMFAPLPALAGDEVGHWYLDPYVGGIAPDTYWQTTGNQALFGLAIGKHLSEEWSAELNANGARLNDKYDSNHLNLLGGSLDALRVFNRGGRFAPYFSIGAGVVQAQPQAFANQTNIAVEAGVGAFIKLWENADDSRSFSLRPDIKARDDKFGQSGNPWDYLYTLGFVYSFGPGRPAPAPPPPPPATPPPPPPPAPPPAPASRCPGTPPGVAVDEYGCPIKGDVVLQGVNFETNSAVLTGDSKPILDGVAQGLKAHPRLKIEIQGHTDSRGSAEYNLGLSQRRANSVRDYLISQGVPGGQMTARGYGLTQPMASNATAAGRASNRRVVMHVLENPGDVAVRKEGQAQQ
jgi:OmpA-OmpF porin, OOP family